MHRFSTGLSILAFVAALTPLALPHAGAAPVIQTVLHQPDFAAAGIDPMPVGTARQMKRMKRARIERRA